MKRIRHAYLAALFCLASCGGTSPTSVEESSIESSEPSSSASSASSASSTSSEFPTGQKIDTDAVPQTQSTDKFRTMYEIFPYSFADSDGDGIGDLMGAADKLEYIHDLNYEGVWLTPVCPSPSYHKYDVLDYYAIDSKFGDLDTFDYFVETAHSLGMTVLFDLVINHAALNNEWFSLCADAVANGETDNPYYGYFNIKQGKSGGDWYSVPGHSGYIYEGVFYSGMPDFNLQSVLDEPEGYLATEIRDICDFWLNDHNVDGFRLDAVTSYFTNDINKNTEFLTWLNTTCKELKPDCYIVGEGSWNGDAAENLAYQASGIDSFFNFVNTGVSAAYSVGKVISSQSAGRLGYGMKESWRVAGEGVPANFIANHDRDRLVGVVGGRNNLAKAKMGHTLLSILPGAVFNYYGDEIGMAIPTGSSENDPDRRLHMNWGDDYTPNDPPGHMAYTDANKAYPYPSAADQLLDSNSLLAHVRKANALRQKFPEIARGRTETIENYAPESGKPTITAISKVTEDSTIYIVVNPSTTEKVIYDFAALGNVTPKAELSVVGESTYSGHELYLAPGSVVILK